MSYLNVSLWYFSLFSDISWIHQFVKTSIHQLITYILKKYYLQPKSILKMDDFNFCDSTNQLIYLLLQHYKNLQFWSPHCLYNAEHYSTLHWGIKHQKVNLIGLYSASGCIFKVQCSGLNLWSVFNNTVAQKDLLLTLNAIYPRPPSCHRETEMLLFAGGSENGAACFYETTENLQKLAVPLSSLPTSHVEHYF